ncbi:MAG: DUF1565 domain-containing protein, partial [Bacteroidia bacterium]
MANAQSTSKQKDKDLIEKQPLEKLKLQASALKKIGKSVAKKTTVLLFMVYATVGFSQSTIYVNHTAAGSNSGANWANAYTSLQSAIATASSGNEIWVAAGTYKPSAYPYNASGSSNRDYAFYLKGGVEIYGGFAGTETTLAQRDPANNPTILSGDIGTANVITDNCYHVIVSANESSAGTLDGFTITKGNANGSSTLKVKYSQINRSSGSGMYNASSSPTITNCTFSNNAGTNGAGMYNVS